MRILIAAIFMIAVSTAGQARADVLARLSQGEPLKIGFRQDAAVKPKRNQDGILGVDVDFHPAPQGEMIVFAQFAGIAGPGQSEGSGGLRPCDGILRMGPIPQRHISLWR